MVAATTSVAPVTTVLLWLLLWPFSVTHRKLNVGIQNAHFYQTQAVGGCTYICYALSTLSGDSILTSTAECAISTLEIFAVTEASANCAEQFRLN